MKLILIESSDIGAQYSAEAARALGYEPVFLCELKDYQGDTRAQLKRYRHYDVPTHSKSEVLKFLRDKQRPGAFQDIAGVMSFADSRLVVAHEVAQALGVHGLDPAVVRLKSKAEVARLTPEFSPPTLVFPADLPPIGALRDLLATAGRIIVKPSQGAGARGVFFIENDAELTRLPSSLRESRVPAEMERDGWIAQAFVEGQLFSAEGFVLNGEARLLGFTGRKKILSTESAAGFPIDSAVTPAARARVDHAISALIGRSGFRNGYFHIEFIHSGEQCHLVDANMGRLGGGPVGELLALSYGFDPIEIYRHVLEVALLGSVSRDPYADHERRRESYAILYGLEKGGELENVEIPSNLRCYHTQILGHGARVSPMGIDDWSWIGILTGLKSDAIKGIEQVKIRTKEGVFSPCY